MKVKKIFSSVAQQAEHILVCQRTSGFLSSHGKWIPMINIVVPTKWLTQLCTQVQSKDNKFSALHPWQCVTFTCFCVLFYSWNPDSCFLFSSLQVELFSWPHQPIPCFACWRQRRLLSAVAHWDRCAMDAMWVAAVRVRNYSFPDELGFNDGERRNLACQYWHHMRYSRLMSQYLFWKWPSFHGK